MHKLAVAQLDTKSPPLWIKPEVSLVNLQELFSRFYSQPHTLPGSKVIHYFFKMFCSMVLLFRHVGRNSVVSTTHYYLDGPGIEHC